MSCDSNLSYRETKVLAFKLRREDPQQFQTLVRMHLSFILELVETEGSSAKTKFRPLKWGRVHFSKKIKAPEREATDNAHLSTDILTQINNLVEFLSKEENVSQEGIFRRSGKLTRQQELKGILQRGSCPNLNDSQYSVHDVSSVLKGFLAELPEPLLTDLYYPVYCHIADMCKIDNGGKARVLRALQLLFLLLPIENRKVLKRILQLLHLTASHVGSNKMSSQNLATIFTPHLLCPRKLKDERGRVNFPQKLSPYIMLSISLSKIPQILPIHRSQINSSYILSPEIFHTTAQSLSCIVVFIINHAKEVFEIPPALATDIKVYWDRRQRTPDHLLERSVSESTAASTVFSFVDREMSVADNNPTETALAQLYAHIQGLPESNKKKRLIKQFNKENGQGTPRTKSIGVSIKKHIFCKNAKAKGYHEFTNLKNNRLSTDEYLSSPMSKKTPQRYVKFSNENKDPKKNGVKRLPTELESEGEESPPKLAREELGGGKASWGASPTPTSLLVSPRSTSTPAVASTPGFHTPPPAPDDMSPITMSAQRMPRAMQEAMITPRSRKPVVALSGSNLCQLGTNDWSTKDLSWQDQNQEEGAEESCEEESLTSPFRDYLFSRSVLTTSPADLSFSSQPGDFGEQSSTQSVAGVGSVMEEPATHPLTDSLLYFLDGGGSPSPSLTTPSGTPQSGSSHCDTPPVTETAL